jgi:trehalose 6-phosphate phosphatase
VLADAGAPEGTRIEDKGSALAVHTRGTDNPEGALAALGEPLAELADAAGLVVEPGRLVIELRPPGRDKGSALAALAAERKSGAILFAGDDLGDLAAFAAVRALREAGHPGLTVCSASGEVTELAAEADLVVAGPDGVVALLRSLARAIASPRPAH